MLSLSINTYVHLLFIIVIFCCLVIGIMLVKERMSYAATDKLTKVDGIYGFAAILVVGTRAKNYVNDLKIIKSQSIWIM